KNNEDRQAVGLTTQVQVLSQQTAKFALESAGGNIDSFKELSSTRNTIDSAVARLTKGDTKSGMPAYSGNPVTGPGVKALNKAWHQLDSDIDKILSNKSLVIESSRDASTLSSQIPELNSSMEQVNNILQQQDGTKAQVFTSARQEVLADRMLRRVQQVLQGGDGAQPAADGLSRDAQLYGQVLGGLINGNSDVGIRALSDDNAQKILANMQEQWAALDKPIKTLIAASPTLQ